MGAIALEGVWLLGGFAVVYLVGVFTSQWAKDKLSGVPADLRSALSTLEAAAKKEIVAAKSKVVADTATLLAKGKAAVVAETVKLTDPAPAPASAPVAAAAKVDSAN